MMTLLTVSIILLILSCKSAAGQLVPGLNLTDQLNPDIQPPLFDDQLILGPHFVEQLRALNLLLETYLVDKEIEESSDEYLLQCCGSASNIMRIRIRDPKNFHMDPDPNPWG